VPIISIFVKGYILMAKRLFKRIPAARTVEEMDTQYVESTMTEAELAGNAAERVDDVVEYVADLEDEVSTVNDGAIAVEALFATVRLAKSTLADGGTGLTPLAVRSINSGTRAISTLLRAQEALFVLKPDDFSTESMAVENTTRLANFKMEALMDAVGNVFAATSQAVTSVAEETASFMTTILQIKESQNAAFSDLLARIQGLKAAGLMSSTATVADPALAYIASAGENNDIHGILATRIAVAHELIDCVTALPESLYEHIMGQDTEQNPYAVAMAEVYVPLMANFTKVSQDTIPFVESGLDPAEWTPYMSKSFGLDGNAAMLSINIPFMEMAAGTREVVEDAADFAGLWFMECDVTGGSATDVAPDAAAKSLDVVEMEQLLIDASADLGTLGDNLVDSVASMSIYMDHFRDMTEDAAHSLSEDDHMAVALGIVVDFSEYVSNVAVKALGQIVGDNDRLIQACAVSIAAIKAEGAATAEALAAEKAAEEAAAAEATAETKPADAGKKAK
jgi:hypothetical protein